MKEENNQTTPNQEIKWKEKVSPLIKYGGFDGLLSPLFDNDKSGIYYFDPDEYSEEELEWYLNDTDSAEQRDYLKTSAKVLLDLLENSDSTEELENNAKKKKETVNQLKVQNLAKIVNKAEPLEKTFRQLDLYFTNAGPRDVEHLTILNVDRKKLVDPDNTVIPAEIKKLISKPHKRIDQDEVYSFVVIPGFLGEELIQTYARIADDSRVLFLSDYDDLNSVKKIVNARKSKKGSRIGGPQPFWRYAAIFSNYIRLREKFEDYGEKDDMFGSPSLAIAAGLYQLHANIAQPFGGFLEGAILKSKGLRIDDVDQEEVKLISDLGLNPLVNAFQQDMAFDARTLFSEEDNPEYVQYAVVRTFAYIDKTMKHFLNKNILKVLTLADANRVKDKILEFLTDLKERNVIEEGSIDLFKRDIKRPDIIHVEIKVKPLWATRTFVYTVDVAKGQNAKSDIK